MRCSCKTFALILVVSLVLSSFPNPSFADQQVTEHPPETIMTPEIKLAGQGGSGWLWIIAGIVIAGGAAAALLGSSGEDDSSSQPETGSYTTTW